MDPKTVFNLPTPKKVQRTFRVRISSDQSRLCHEKMVHTETLKNKEEIKEVLRQAFNDCLEKMNYGSLEL